MTGQFKVLEIMKINAFTYCNFIVDAHTYRLDELPLSDLSKVVFIHDKAPPRYAKRTEGKL